MGNESPEDQNILNSLAASVESLRDRVDGVHGRVEGLHERVDGLYERVDGLYGRVDGLEQHIITVGARLTTLGEQVAAGFTAVRGDIERVHVRLDTMDRALTTRLDQMDTQISRLRSVVYLLAKDQPELLRLLGPPPTS